MKKQLIIILIILIASMDMFAQRGKCGDNLSWSFDSNTGELIITGSGEMDNYQSTTYSPWSMYRTSIRSVSLPSGMITIGDYAFAWCSNLSFIIIPNSVKSIGEKAFCGCKSLQFLTLPSSVTIIGAYAFSNCSNLLEVSIPDGVTIISKGSFAWCSSLTSISLPNSVMHVGAYAFSQCKSMSSLTLPISIKSIGDRAFEGCFSLALIKMPMSLKKNTAVWGISSAVNIEYLGPEKSVNPENIAIPVNKSNLPPLLNFIEESLVFVDASKNNRIDANEQCSVKFQVSNKGKGPAIGSEARVKLLGSTSGLSVSSVKLPTMAAGNTYEVNIPVSADINTTDGNVTISIEVYEPNGWGVAPFDLIVATKAYEQPFLQVVDYNVASSSGKIRKMEPFTLTFNLQNTKYGDAEDVNVQVKLPVNIYVMDGSSEVTFPQVKSGEAKPIILTLAVNNNYSATEIPINIEVKEKYGKFAENKKLNLAINATATGSVTITARDEPQTERKEIKLALLSADVDRNIPIAKEKNQNTFVLIIANENYQRVASVPFALNDGNIFREYCLKSFGIPEKHVHYIANATYNQIREEVHWLKNITAIFDDAQIIFYYAGHGIPDEASRNAYLLPVDGSGIDVTTGYKLDELYTTLGKMPASKTIVFMDACFSGTKRGEGMLANARGVALKTKSGVPQGNMVVFSAAQGDETAYPLVDQQHGLFTYYLLKKLQETRGDVTLEDLGAYIITNVRQQSIVENGKSQTPAITASSEAQNWQQWKLK